MYPGWHSKVTEVEHLFSTRPGVARPFMKGLRGLQRITGVVCVCECVCVCVYMWCVRCMCMCVRCVCKGHGEFECDDGDASGQCEGVSVKRSGRM